MEGKGEKRRRKQGNGEKIQKEKPKITPKP